MKLVHINSLYAPFQVGGAEKSVQILAEAQHALGHQVSVLCTAPDGRPRQADVNGIDVHYLPVRNLYRPFTDEVPGAIRKALWHGLDTYNPLMEQLIGSKLDALKPDIVHTHTIAGLSVSAWHAAERRGIPRVHTLRDYYLACPRSTMFKGEYNCVRPCSSCGLYAAPRRRQSAKVNAVIGNSRFILDRHLDLGYFPAATIREVIFSGQAAALEAGPVKRPIADWPVFGYIGQINPTKGLGLLVEAFRELGPGARLRIAGRIDSVYAESLRAAAPEGVEWLGWMTPAAFYASIDTIVVPSLWHEPLPRTVIEAATHGCRVIGSTRGGTPEAVTLVGGMLFDPDTPGALVDALRRGLGRRDEARTAAEAVVRLATAFDPQARANDYLTVYRSLVP